MPQHVFAALDREFHFELDVCASPANAKCLRFFTASEDGLAQGWTGICWMNPPYGRGIGARMKKAADEAERGATVVCLVPARTDTKWWHHQAMERAAEIRLVRGRLKFGVGLAPAPFPSALVVYRPRREAALVVSAWKPPASSAPPAQPRHCLVSDANNSMKSSRRPNLAACPANDDSSTRHPSS
jgi:hypothetical protein